MPPSYKLFFVCTANICRSPIAEGLAASVGLYHNLTFHARSGGTMGIIGKSPAPNSIKTMRKIGFDISTQKSAGITKQDMEWADYILVMAPKHAKKLRIAFPNHEDKILILANFGGMIQIDDPIGKWIFSFHSCRKSIHKSLRGFTKQIAMRHS
jgi:protein-tyrosine phosphatase